VRSRVVGCSAESLDSSAHRGQDGALSIAMVRLRLQPVATSGAIGHGVDVSPVLATFVVVAGVWRGELRRLRPSARSSSERWVTALGTSRSSRPPRQSCRGRHARPQCVEGQD
jgi:hypothetical protein